MSLFILPINDTNVIDVHWKQTTTLEGVQFRLFFWYSQTEDCYYLNVGDPNVTDGSWIVSSIKLLTNKALLRRWRGAAAASCAIAGNPFIWPAGELVTLSRTNDDSTARLGELGNRVKLFYITSDDPLLAAP